MTKELIKLSKSKMTLVSIGMLKKHGIIRTFSSFSETITLKDLIRKSLILTKDFISVAMQ